MKDNYINIKSLIEKGLTKEQIYQEIDKQIENFNKDNEKEIKNANYREEIIKLLKEYLTYNNYIIKGDFEKILENKLKLIETKDFPFPFLNFDEIFKN